MRTSTAKPAPERLSDPALLVLSSLAESDKHGYAIMTDVEAFAGIRLGPATLYGVIQRLEDRGLIQALEGDERRRPYRLTGEGQTYLKRQLDHFYKVARLGLQRLEAL